MNNKVLVSILGLLIIILTGTTVYFATAFKYKNAQPVSTDEVESNIEEVESTIPPKETVSPSEPSESIDWQTYNNSKIGFSIKYPKDWPVRAPDPDCGALMICEMLFGTLPTDPSDTAALSNRINLMVHSPSLIQSNQGDGFTDCNIIDASTTLESGLSAEVKVCNASNAGAKLYVYTVKYNGWWYQLISPKGPEAAKVFDQMANSFSFLK